jgi:hypothetical protein
MTTEADGGAEGAFYELAAHARTRAQARLREINL